MQLLTYLLFESTIVTKHSNSKDSASQKQVQCLVRREWVQDTPEERVRQYALYRLLEQGYSRALIAVERAFIQLGTRRRMDILVHDKDAKPFLLIECKRYNLRLGNKDFEQLLSYQTYWKATHMALFNGKFLRIFTPTPEGDRRYALKQDFPDPPN